MSKDDPRIPGDIRPVSRERSVEKMQFVDHHRIKKGLDIPISGQPAPFDPQNANEKLSTSSVAVVCDDYPAFKPGMQVSEGDQVKIGDVLCLDKNNPALLLTSPGAGTVRRVARGARRVLQYVEIELDEGADEGNHRDFSDIHQQAMAERQDETLATALIQTGLWGRFRTRPYNKVPRSEERPAGLFITAIDSDPLAASATDILRHCWDDFCLGLQMIAPLSQGKTYVCCASDADLPDLPACQGAELAVHGFQGPHPSGLAGTHIHTLMPAHGKNQVWQIGYQDVIAIGAFFRTGKLSVTQYVSLSGPNAKNPRIIQTRIGANLTEICAGEEEQLTDRRIISGSVLSGRVAVSDYEEGFPFLGYRHRHVTLMAEQVEKQVLGWIRPGWQKIAQANVHPSALMRGKKTYPLTTGLQGSPRAFVPLGLYEDVFPMDMLITPLLRAILILDTDMAQNLGVLELDEEDLALCSFICLSKYEYGLALRACLQKIELEG